MYVPTYIMFLHVNVFVIYNNLYMYLHIICTFMLPHYKHTLILIFYAYWSTQTHKLSLLPIEKIHNLAHWPPHCSSDQTNTHNSRDTYNWWLFRLVGCMGWLNDRPVGGLVVAWMADYLVFCDVLSPSELWNKHKTYTYK